MFEKWVREKGLHFQVEDSSTPARQLGSWYALKGVLAGKQEGQRDLDCLKV